MAEAYIVAAARTAGGRKGGRLAGWHPADLAAVVLDSLVERTGADPALVEDVIMGCVMQAGEQSNNIARNAIMASKLPESVPGTSIDRQCGSSQQALHFAAQAVMSGAMDVVIAAGVESMTRVPMGLASSLPAKNGFGHYKSPNMEQRYPNIQFSQFTGAEMMAKKYDLDKEALDRYSFESHQRAIAATQAGAFKDEIVPVAITRADGSTDIHQIDEGIRFDATLDGIRGVKLITEGGRLTAASASQICDGASGVMVVNENGLKALGVKPMARIHHMTMIGHDPVIMLEAPLPATHRALKKAGMSIDDIDLFEVNEAFASVPTAWLKDTGADPAKLNVNGGAIALGHPLGGSGTKLMTTLLHALKQRNKRYGLQTMCEGGGMANVTIVERL
ncbi:acetyl-CoA C-acetyltransferase [Bradyrhizobium sp. U87765 SZCCT0131]|uniref:acetyl-CoA C-acetyltransferase n=1 Tax=unclassified Bradyrhizobium TaxID=2631580 RepID=UPI001BA7F943|nr:MULTISPECIES: acetyl-CoA C-acetyltransferase [unclassified Bradyrhizobium]MBR1217586.1 acetyl-CoA C-acetyltransferase [Bradyrhizobium sp. U87765 SZCCT0131]MBR1264816.1 acetyl-CoA C-acetyltransferase [Bradyrhizobium sp. U87765 SZCCT0134]MBR1304798.1 acetyl-CoA C-acetyltransferase [Bradyrhizobium sp. U87765 SZCCT0110]MBR1320585.1 acetyl-CoA C-acetyltransferase [Bradyrhizobium sp. U87765 SZCCT0109]MBR1349005.1 acetyl-CoA C-acetyltransferase [Bradyrhizobium sp. U87765 SZCCT0048]